MIDTSESTPEKPKSLLLSMLIEIPEFEQLDRKEGAGMDERMISFEQKKSIFQSFHLQIKDISNGRVDVIFPASLRKGKRVATQLHPSGNGYVNGNYMTVEILTKKGYVVDKRGWINIKYFTKERLIEVIEDAIASMKN